MKPFNDTLSYRIGDAPFWRRRATKFRRVIVAFAAILYALFSAAETTAQTTTGRIYGSVALPPTTATLTGKIIGLEVYLINENGRTIGATTTTIGGAFSFVGLSEGEYQIIPVSDNGEFFPRSIELAVSTTAIARPNFTFTPTTLPVIAGQTLTASDSLPFPFAVVSVTNASFSLRPNLDAQGRFAFTVSTAGSYTFSVTASTLRAGYVFDPKTVEIVVDSNGVVKNSPVKVLAAIPTYRLNGFVRGASGDNISGTAIIRIEQQLSAGFFGNLITTIATVSATANEFWVFVTGGTYRVSGSLATVFPTLYTIAPIQRIVTVANVGVNVGEILISNRRYTLSGRIVATNGTIRVPLANVPVRLSPFFGGVSITTATTDSAGNFRLLADAVQYTGIPLQLTVGLRGYTLQYGDVIADSVLNISGLRDNLALGDIIAVPIPAEQFPVVGRVLYPNHFPVQAPLTAVVTNASGAVRTSFETPVSLSADGRYSIPNVTSGVFLISLRSPNLIFSPSVIEVFMPRDNNVEFNFNATIAPIIVTGRVVTLLGTPVAGVRMSVPGVVSASATTDADGRYQMTVAGQYPDSRWQILPTLPDASFAPPARLVVTDISTAALNQMDFRATSITSKLPLATLSGRIVTFDDAGREIGLGNVIVSDGTRSARSLPSGEYVIRDVPNGSYRLTPVLEGYAFTPDTLQASVIGGVGSRNQNFVARLRRDIPNKAPFVQTRINDITVIASATTSVPLASVFRDDDKDALILTTVVEDPTLLRTRLRGGTTLLIDALSEGNTMVSVTANDNKGGTTTASFRVSVSRPVVTPTQFVRPLGNLNTNINASIVIEPQTVAAIAGLPSSSLDKNGLLSSFVGELGAFNERCECVGSVVWTGNNVVLPVWGENEENRIPGMKPSELIHIRYIDNIERRSRRTRAMYSYNLQPGPWPIDQATIVSIPMLEDDECIPTQTSIVSAHLEANYFNARVTPNPARQAAHLSYSLPAAAAVTVEMWNMLGQRVATLLSGEYQSSGAHSIPLDVDSLPSGTYACRIIASSATASRNISTIRLSVIR
jgi:hypothetical protein